MCSVPRLAREKIPKFKFKIALIMCLQLFCGMVWIGWSPSSTFCNYCCGTLWQCVLHGPWIFCNVTDLIHMTLVLSHPLYKHCKHYICSSTIDQTSWLEFSHTQTVKVKKPTEKKHLFWNHGFCCDISWILPDDCTREFDENTIRW